MDVGEDRYVKSKVLIAFLKRTMHSLSVSIDELSQASLVARGVVSFVLEEVGVEVRGGRVLVDRVKRTEVAMELAKIGTSPSSFLRFLDWRDFESFASSLLLSFGFEVAKNIRIASHGVRAQIDLLALRDNLIMSLDCKRWTKLAKSSMSQAALKQLSRTQLLTNKLESLGKGSFTLYVIPAVLSLIDPCVRLNDGIPVIPVSKFKSFLEGLTDRIDGLKTIKLSLILPLKLKHLAKGLYPGIKGELLGTGKLSI